MYWLLGSLTLYLLSCGLLHRHRALGLVVALLGAVLALATAAHLMSLRLVGSGIDEAVLYHLIVGLEGARWEDFKMSFLLAYVLTLLYAWGCYRLVMHRLVIHSQGRRWVVALALLLMIGAFDMNPGIVGTLRASTIYLANHAITRLPKDLIYPKSVALREGVKTPKNLVLIYAKSLKASYFDSERFPDKNLFYQSHGTHRIEGRDQLQSRFAEPDYANRWGLYDDSLLDMAKARFDELASDSAPFSLTLLTLDTHHPQGHVSRSCQNMPYREGDNPILNAVFCSDRLLSDFIGYLRKSRHADETLIVLMPDHLGMPNTAPDLLQQKPRRNLFMMPGDSVESVSHQVIRLAEGVELNVRATGVLMSKVKQ